MIFHILCGLIFPSWGKMHFCFVTQFNTMFRIFIRVMRIWIRLISQCESRFRTLTKSEQALLQKFQDKIWFLEGLPSRSKPNLSVFEWRQDFWWAPTPNLSIKTINTKYKEPFSKMPSVVAGKSR